MTRPAAGEHARRSWMSRPAARPTGRRPRGVGHREERQPPAGDPPPAALTAGSVAPRRTAVKRRDAGALRRYRRPMATTTLTGTGAIELARLVRVRAASATEVVEAHLRRIEAVDGELNAVVALDAERALAAASEADAGGGTARCAACRSRSRTTSRRPACRWRSARPSARASSRTRTPPPCARLRGGRRDPARQDQLPAPTAAGSRPTTRSTGARATRTTSSRTPGGSSGGEAAIVAAGGSRLRASGTDSGASVRLPAHFCGLACAQADGAAACRSPACSTTRGRSARSATRARSSARSPAPSPTWRSCCALIAGPDGRDGGAGRRCRSATPPRSHAARTCASPWHDRERAGHADAARRSRPSSGRAAALRDAGARGGRGAAIPAAATSSPSRSGAPTAAALTSAELLPPAAPLGRLPRRAMLAFARAVSTLILSPVFPDSGAGRTATMRVAPGRSTRPASPRRTASPAGRRRRCAAATLARGAADLRSGRRSPVA